MVFALNYKGDTVDMNELISYFDCNPMKILEYSDDFEDLRIKGILERHKTMYRMGLPGNQEQYSINEKVTQAILKNKAMPLSTQTGFKDVIQVLEKLYSLFEQKTEGEITAWELLELSNEIIMANLHFPLLKVVHNYQLKSIDSYFYLYLIWMTVVGNESIELNHAFEGLFDISSEKVKYSQKIFSGENQLLKNGLIQLEESRFFNDAEIKLSENSVNMLDEMGIKLFSNRRKKGNIFSPESIPLRNLFFDEEKMKPLFMLKQLLQESQLSETQKRLTEKRLPKGITILFHGLPGTGKTETALQMAKYTEREIMKVEISQSKSMWYGESEKIIKKIFTDYKSLCKECDHVPILLFNEADAILSKRKGIGSSTIDQTENAIQNILLEELENFEGILIATTNLASNLDSAFDRRFLFKVEFQKPDTKVKALIWRSKLPGLDTPDYELLAFEFDFSGGQIDNIVRKSEIHEIIHGKQVDLKSVMEFCKEEVMGKSKGRIGFSLF